LKQADIDWSTTEVLLHNLAGANYSAGLDSHTNWLYAAIKAMAGTDFDTERMLIVPYADLPASVGTDALSDADFNYLSTTVWGALFTRPDVARKAMAYVADIKRKPAEAIPGDFELTDADNIEDFIRRLKFSVSDPREMLSNTVGFWLAGEALDKNWDLAAMDLPGFTAGLPEGISSYPDNSRAIPETNVAAEVIA